MRAAIFIFSIFISCIANGQRLIPYRKGDLWGYCDSTKKVVIQPKYDKVSFFFMSGNSVVLTNGELRLIDKHEKIIYQIKGDDFSVYYPDKIIIVYNDKVGLINSYGQVLIPDTNYSVYATGNPNIFCVKNYMLSNSKKDAYELNHIVLKNEKYIINHDTSNEDGNQIMKYFNSMDDFQKHTLNYRVVVFSDNSGRVDYCLDDTTYKSDTLIEFANGLFEKREQLYNVNKGLFSKEIFDDDIKDFGNGLAGCSENGKWGFIDTNLNIVIQPRFDEVKEFQNGYCAVKTKGHWGFINTKGDFVIHPKFDDVGIEVNKFGVWVNKKSKWGFINFKGNKIIPWIYDDINFFDEGYCGVEKKEKWGYVDSTGKVVIPFKFSEAAEFSDGYTCVALTDSTNNSGYINKKGEVVIPFRYSYGGYFNEGLAEVMTNKNDTSRFGFIDKKGQIIIPIKYESVSDGNCFSNGIGQLMLPSRKNERGNDNYYKRMFYFDRKGTLFFDY